MKRKLVVSILVLAGAYPASAGAAGWQGVVLAKDGARHAVATASAGGTVRTVRVGRSYAALRVGQRVSVSARALADRTFSARRVAIVGRAGKARVRAVVVRYDRQLSRYLVSAGGSVFAIRTRWSRSLASAGDDDDRPGAGDKIVADVTVSGVTLQAQQITQVGHLATIRIEGIILELSATSIKLVVAKAGFVTVTIPAGMKLSDLKVFDQVQLVVSVGTSGSFTLISARGDRAGRGDDNGPRGDDEDEDDEDEDEDDDDEEEDDEDEDD